MSESFEDQLSRVGMMASGSPTWDLSPNDIAALKAVLANRNRQADMIAELRGLLDEMTDSQSCNFDHHGYCQTHNLHERPCPHERAKKILGKE